MAIPHTLAERLALPAICAPLFLISTPELVTEARKGGLVGALPRQNARTQGEFDSWLSTMSRMLDEWSNSTGITPGPLAVNVPTTLPPDELRRELELCARNNVDVIITSVGKPTEVTRIAHDLGMAVHHDVTSIEFAEKAIEAGVDGLNCIGAGGGGHSGTISHLALIPRIRRMFDGVVSLAGAVATGSAIRAAEVLGADLAFIGTRFSATIESGADPLQKEWLASGTSRDLSYTRKVNGIPANWMLASLRHHGIDLDELPEPEGRGHAHLPDGVTPWRDLWSAGQGIELIDDIPTAEEVIRQLAEEYVAACAVPDRSASARRLTGGA